MNNVHSYGGHEHAMTLRGWERGVQGQTSFAGPTGGSTDTSVYRNPAPAPAGLRRATTRSHVPHRAVMEPTVPLMPPEPPKRISSPMTNIRSRHRGLFLDLADHLLVERDLLHGNV